MMQLILSARNGPPELDHYRPTTVVTKKSSDDGTQSQLSRFAITICLRKQFIKQITED